MMCLTKSLRTLFLVLCVALQHVTTEARSADMDLWLAPRTACTLVVQAQESLVQTVQNR